MSIKDQLKEDITFVLQKGDILHTSTYHGVRPILELLANHQQLLNDAEVADRVIGKAAALLLAKGKIHSLYAEVLSEHAIPVLKTHAIEYSYGSLVPYIENRTKSGMCPLEETVLSITDPNEAEIALRARIAQLMKQH